MMFQHTIQQVLDGTKTQTARIWKPNYGHVLEKNNSLTIFSKVSGRKLYYVGQEIAIQPGRGKKGVARRRITSIGKYDVRCFDGRDFIREGFGREGRLNASDLFYMTWLKMHDPKLWELKRKSMEEVGVFRGYLINRPDEHYLAAVFRFEKI